MKENPLKKRKKSSPCLECRGKGTRTIYGSTVRTVICDDCLGSGKEWIVCCDCWTKKHPREFRGKHKPFVKRCQTCQDKYRSGAKRRPARHSLPDQGPILVKMNIQSNNTKTGTIPVSMTSSPSCPMSCSLRNGACYAERHFLGVHWRRLSAGAGMTWDFFCRAVKKLPDGQVWRHNEAGDLPGQGDVIDATALSQLVEANRGKRGFTYTHKPVLEDGGMYVANRLAIMDANENGFVVNLSADDVEHADALADLGIGPVCVTLPPKTKKRLRTPMGKHIVVCPAQWSEQSCETCKLCAVPKRKAIIGFWGHGPGKNKIGSTFQLPLFRKLTKKAKGQGPPISKAELAKMGRQLLTVVT